MYHDHKLNTYQEEEEKRCLCNFEPPHPLRVNDIYGVLIGGKYYPEEFFCSFCKGLITNDTQYIEEVIKYHSAKTFAYLVRQDEGKSKDYYRSVNNREKDLLNDYKYLKTLL